MSMGTIAAENELQATLVGDKDIEMIQVIGQATGGIDQLITLEDIEKLQANTLGDLFKIDATITAGGPVAMGQKVYVRNIGEDALNITIDGAELSAGIFHHSGRVMIEPELLKQIEIEAGTGNAAAGPGALGGALRFTTKDPEDLLVGSENFGALLKSTYFSNGEGLKNTVSLYGRDSGGIFSGLVSVTQSDQNNHEDGEGNDLAGSESDRGLGYAKLVANISEEQYLSLSYEKLEEEGDILYRPEWIASYKNTLSPTEGTRDTFIFNYGFDSVGNDLLNLSVNLYQTESEQVRDTNVVGNVETTGTTIKNTSEIGNHKLVIGTNYRRDESALSYPYYSVAYPGGDTESGEVKAAFVQDVVELSEALTVSAGLRFDDYEMIDWKDDEYSDSGLSSNISANYKLTDSLHLSAGYSEALRGVEIADAYRIEAYNNEADLEAEEAQNIELGMDYYGDNFHIAFGAYQTTIEKAFSHYYLGRSLFVENQDDGLETDGFYLKAEYQYNDLTATASFLTADTEVAGEVATRYEYGSSAASIGDTLALSLDYAITNQLQAGWVAEFVKGMHDLNIEADGDALTLDKPGYGIHDVYLKWSGLENNRLNVSLTVKNMLNKQYLSHASVEDFRSNPGYGIVSGQPEAGRDVYLSASLQF